MGSARRSWVGCGGLARRSDTEVEELLETFENPCALYVCSINGSESNQLFLVNPDSDYGEDPDMSFYDHQYMLAATDLVERLSSMYGVDPETILAGVQENLMKKDENS